MDKNITKLKNLIEAQRMYIYFLEREMSGASPLLLLHGWTCPQHIVDEGNKLRTQIEKYNNGALES